MSDEIINSEMGFAEWLAQKGYVPMYDDNRRFVGRWTNGLSSWDTKSLFDIFSEIPTQI